MIKVNPLTVTDEYSDQLLLMKFLLLTIIFILTFTPILLNKILPE